MNKLLMLFILSCVYLMAFAVPAIDASESPIRTVQPIVSNGSVAPSPAKDAAQLKSYIDRHDYNKAINTGESEYSKSQNSTIALYLGKAYFLKQNYDKAVKYFSVAANKNEALAMLTLGNLYGSGVGVKQNYVKAVYWYKKAVAKGNVAAMNYLGLIYRDGIGTIDKDSKAAFDLFTKAASLNNDEGYFNLGYLYQNGIGVDKDNAKAIANYMQAANLGNVLAMNDLAYMYENGVGVTQNYKEALNWYMLSAAKGDANAECAVG
ncbi:MAG TPA: tetratricopeptide repeat protein, partial [Aquella sp.]|nr:tetratricopeptide repeat protein [Aquella sp.]